MADSYLYDSQQDFQGGMQGGFDPGHVADDQFYRGINLSVRNGVLAPRPSFKEIDLDFSNITVGEDAQSIAQSAYNIAVSSYDAANALTQTYVNNGNTVKNAVRAKINSTFDDASNSTYVQTATLEDFLTTITSTPKIYQNYVFGINANIEKNSLHEKNGVSNFYGVAGTNLSNLYTWEYNEGTVSLPVEKNKGVPYKFQTQNNRPTNLKHPTNLNTDNLAKEWVHHRPFPVNYSVKSGEKLTTDLIAILQLGQRVGLYNTNYISNPPTTNTTITQTHINQLIQVLFGTETQETVKLDRNNNFPGVGNLKEGTGELDGETIEYHNTVKPVRDIKAWDFQDPSTGPTILKSLNRLNTTTQSYENIRRNLPVPCDFANPSNNGPYNLRYGNIDIFPNDNPNEWLIDRGDISGNIETPTIFPISSGQTNKAYNARSFAHIRSIAQLLAHTEQSLDAEIFVRGKMVADLSVSSLNATDNEELQKRKVSECIPFPVRNTVPKINGIVKSTTADYQGTITSFHYEYVTGTAWSEAANDDAVLVNELRPYYIYFGLKDIKDMTGNLLSNDEILRIDDFGDNLEYQGLDNNYNTLIPSTNYKQDEPQTVVYNKRLEFQNAKNRIMERGYYDIFSVQYFSANTFGTITPDYRTGYLPSSNTFEINENTHFYDFQDDTNILINEEFEAGTPGQTPPGWEKTGGSGYTINTTADGTQHSGSQYVQVRGRSANWHGIRQDVTTHINESSINNIYTAAVRLRAAGSTHLPSGVKIALDIRFTDGVSKKLSIGSIDTSDTNTWYYVTNNINFQKPAGTETKTIDKVFLIIVGKDPADTQNDYDVDSVVLKELTSPGLSLKRGFFGSEWEQHIQSTSSELNFANIAVNQAAAELNSTGINFVDNFKKGRFQGSLLYKTPNAKYSVVVISGHIYLIDLDSYKITVLSRNDTKMNQYCERVYMVQAERHFIIQDGINKPRILTGAALRLSDTDNFEVPVGTNMAYGQGRLAVQVSDKHFRIGDIHLAYSQNNVLKFKETEFLNEGGGFTVSGKLGKIVSLQFANVADTSTGDGPLLAICENGFSTFAINNPRRQWNNIAIQKVQMIGTAMTGKDAYVNINEDILYRSPEGVRSYSVGRSEANSGFRFSEITKEVDPYIENDSNTDIQYVRLAYFDKRLLITSGSKIVNSEGNEYSYWYSLHASQTDPQVGLTDDNWEDNYNTALLALVNGKTPTDFEERGEWLVTRWNDETYAPTDDGSLAYAEAVDARKIKNYETNINGVIYKVTNDGNKSAMLNSIAAKPSSTSAEIKEKAFWVEHFLKFYKPTNSADDTTFKNWYHWQYTYLRYKEQILKDTVFQGLISFDFSLAGYTKSTKQSQSARLKSGSYDGLWTGLNITDIFSYQDNGSKKCLIYAKRQNDNENTLYELTKEITGCDYSIQTNYKKVPIQQSVDLRAMPFKTAQTYIDSPFVFKHIDDLTLWLNNIHDEVTIECFAKSDVVTQYTKIGEVTVLASTSSTNNPNEVGEPQSRAMVRLKDMTEQYDSTTDHPIRNGNEFQFRLKWSGNIQIRRFLVAARKITAPKLDNIETTKTTYPIDTYNEFGYSAN